MSEMSLDEIMSGRGEAASEPTPTAPEAAPAPAASAESASRDDKGRFAPKASDLAPVQPAASAAPAPVQEGAEQQPNGFVPIKALDSERGKRKELEDQLRDMQQQITRLSQPTKPAEPPPPPPSMFEDPDAYLQHQIQPLQKQLSDQKEQFSELMAIKDHGAETINAAKAAVEQIAATPDGQMIISRMLKSAHPYEELVKWHKEQSFRSDIGSDPEAYKKRIIDEYLASQQQQPQAAAPAAPAAAPVLPTAFANKPTSGPRGGAEYGGPRSLSEIMKR